MGEEYDYDAGTLKEILVTPTIATKSALNKLKQIIPNKKLRLSIMNTRYNSEDEYSTIDRMHDLWKRGGKPKIQSFENLGWFGKLIQPIIDSNIGIRSKNIHRATYDPASNTMTIGRFSDFLPELAHAYLYYNNNIPKGGLFNTGFGLPSDIKIMGRDGYDRYTNPEFMAHEIIEPRLHDYLTNYQGWYPRTSETLDDIERDMTTMYYNPLRYFTINTKVLLNKHPAERNKPSNIIGNTIPLLRR